MPNDAKRIPISIDMVYGLLLRTYYCSPDSLIINSLIHSHSPLWPIVHCTTWHNGTMRKSLHEVEVAKVVWFLMGHIRQIFSIMSSPLGVQLINAASSRLSPLWLTLSWRMIWNAVWRRLLMRNGGSVIRLRLGGIESVMTPLPTYDYSSVWCSTHYLTKFWSRIQAITWTMLCSPTKIDLNRAREEGRRATFGRGIEQYADEAMEMWKHETQLDSHVLRFWRRRSKDTRIRVRLVQYVNQHFN